VVLPSRSCRIVVFGVSGVDLSPSVIGVLVDILNILPIIVVYLLIRASCSLRNV
jgi:hypothetical protein